MAALPLVCGELRKPLGCGARPVCLAMGAGSCVLGFEDGAVAAWHNGDASFAVDDSSGGRDGNAGVGEGAVVGGDADTGPRWVVNELEGSGGDACPVDALAILPACLAHASGAVAVAHGGIAAKGVPRPARVAILCLDTGRELRALTMPMAWPDGGICPVARLVAVGREGGFAAVSAARVYRMGEGAQGFQGSFATMAVWSGGSSAPTAVVPAGPQHQAPIGADVSVGGATAPAAATATAPAAAAASSSSGAGAAAGRGGRAASNSRRERHAAEPILAPFVGLAAEEQEHAHAQDQDQDQDQENENERGGGGSSRAGPGSRVAMGPGSTTIVLRAAHATLSPADSSLRLSLQEWHLVQTSSLAPSSSSSSSSGGGGGGGGVLRPVRVVEFPSFCLGGRSQMDLLRAEAGVEGVSAFGAEAAERAAPAVAVWSQGCAATWAGCQPRAAVWRLSDDSGDTIGGGSGGGGGEVRQSRASAALERCLAGVTRRATALLPLPSAGRSVSGPRSKLRGSGPAAASRLLVLTHDHAAFNVHARLFVVTTAEEQKQKQKQEQEQKQVPPGKEAASVVTVAAGGGQGGGGGGDGVGGETEVEAAAADVGVEPCPICLEDPGCGGGESGGRDASAKSAADVGTLTIDDVNLSEHDLKNPAPFNPDRGSGGGEILYVPCCLRAFCRGCLRDYLVAFPRGGCPHCRDIHTFTSLAPHLGVSADRADEPTPWREVSFNVFQSQPPMPAPAPAPAPARAAASSASRGASPDSSLLSPLFLRGIGRAESSPAGVQAGGGGSVGGAGGGTHGAHHGQTVGGGDGDSVHSCVLASPSYVGSVGGSQGDDESLVPMERATMAVDHALGRAVVLTRSGAAVLDVREETLRAHFAAAA